MVVRLRALTSIAPFASIVTGLLLVLSGVSLGEFNTSQAGWGFVTAGMALQAIYLVTRHVS